MLIKYDLKNILERAKTEAIKDSLENLSLYLNEIEKLINLPDEACEQEHRKYKLQLLEHRISEMDNRIKLISGTNKNENFTIS